MGCKSDLVNERKITTERGQELAIRHNARYVLKDSIKILCQISVNALETNDQRPKRESLLI